MISTLYGWFALAEVLQRLLARPPALHKGVLRGDALPHALLDGGQIVRRQRARQLHVVVEAVLDGRTDGELRAWEQLLHRLRHHVRGAVPHALERRVRHRRGQFLFDRHRGQPFSGKETV